MSTTRQSKDKNKKESKTVDNESVTQVDVKVAKKRDYGLVRIVLISDTHNKHEKLEMPEGDVLIHAGDFTNVGTEQEIREFDMWLASLDFQHKILVPGNHDKGTDKNALLRESENVQVTELENATVLRGVMVEFFIFIFSCKGRWSSCFYLSFFSYKVRWSSFLSLLRKSAFTQSLVKRLTSTVFTLLFVVCLSPW